MTWRLSHALEQLRLEVDAAFPARSKISDGTIGDAAHQARTSDHNADEAGIVHAWDVTADPPRGVAQAVVDFLVNGQDRRLKYVIWQDRIMAGHAGPHPWEWRPYQPNNPGRNQHRHHAHVSVIGDDGAPWGFPDRPTPTPPPEVDDMYTDADRQRDKDVATKVDALWNDYARKGKGVRQVLLETAERTKALVSGQRPEGR